MIIHLENPFVLFLSLCFVWAVAPPPPPPPPPPPGALFKSRSLGGAPPPPPPPPPPLWKGGGGKSPVSFADAIRQKAIDRGGSVGEEPEEKAPQAKAPPPPPPPSKTAVPLSPIAPALSPIRSRRPTPFPRNLAPISDESAQQLTPISRRRGTPLVRKVTESAEEDPQRLGRVRRIFASEESDGSQVEKAATRRRHSTASVSSALSFAESEATTPTKNRKRKGTALPKRKAAQRAIIETEAEEQSEEIELGRKGRNKWTEEQMEEIELGRKGRNKRVDEWAEEQRTMGQRAVESAEFVPFSGELVNERFAYDKMPESILLGFPLPPSPSGIYPDRFDAPDLARSPNVMDYRRHTQNEADEGHVQEVAISGEFLCGRTQPFHPAAVYLREFFWESGVRDQWGTENHSKWVKRIVGLYALRPSFGSFTFKIVRPTASYQVQNGEESEPKISRKSRRRWRRALRGFPIGKRRRRAEKKETRKADGEADELRLLETEHSQFELVFDRGTCGSEHKYGAEPLFEEHCLSEFARKPNWNDREWRKKMNAGGKCSAEIMNKDKDRICVQRVGEVNSETEFVEKSMGPIRVDKCTGQEENEPTKGGKKPRRDKPRTERQPRRFWKS
ncbi:hypothetical protein niasHS_012057 [Heterodera schachtii]|uniref:Uncharacterized protein n=1 Tax=Heterodera schachtii TaxID=97005 RepID=A0ABD2IK09_HETSC